MSTVTFLQIRTWAAQRADMEAGGGASGFISSQEAKDMANMSIRAWVDMLMKARGDQYFELSALFNTVANTQTYALATIAPGFYKLTTLYYNNGSGRFVRIPQYNPTESEDQVTGQGWGSFSNLETQSASIRYRIQSANLRFVPTPTAVYQCKINYLKEFVDLVADGDTLETFGEQRWIIWDVAAAYLAKQESDPSYCLAQRDQETQRILGMVDKDFGEPPKVQDVRRGDWWF